MTETAGADGLIDSDAALEREAQVLAERFPGHDRGDLEHRLHERFEELADRSAIKAHLVTVAMATVTDDLVADGEEVRSPLMG